MRVGAVPNPHFAFLGLGSCFVQNLEPHLKQWEKPYLYNPFGTSFNPISIAHQLRALLTGDWQPQYAQHQQVYHDLAAANRFQHHSQQTLVEETVKALNLSRTYIDTHGKINLIISFGTAHAWYYQGAVVNNCHKIPGELFQRKLLKLNEMVEEWLAVLELVPDSWNIIFTVSPVKYTRIGLEENFLGKSLLRMLVEALLDHHTGAVYFPSYEIITDELRDYRFWNTQGTHPTEEAVEVVMERFKPFLSLAGNPELNSKF
jgi:hypothetical protein